MSDPPRLFDTGLLATRRARARGIGGADFLHEAASAEISERLGEVNRTFPRAALIGPRPDIWAPALRAAGVERIDAAADAETLELPGGGYDLAVHALALHWANDPVGQLVQIRRALRPDGLLIAAMLGGRTLQELRASLAAAEAEVSGGLSPRVAPMGEIRDLGGLVQRAGFALPVADGRLLDASYPSALHLMRDLRAMGETNVMTWRSRLFLRRALLARAAEIYAAGFPHGPGRVRASFELIFLTGWAPDPSQPQPLRPGSAAMRLSDALAEAARGPGGGEDGA